MDYLTFFGFRDAPFRITPDPHYFFPSSSHEEALQTLLYSVKAGEGFIQITGDPGTGKTLLLKTMLRELGEEVKTALILSPNLSPAELLYEIVEDFDFTEDREALRRQSKGQQLKLFRNFLLEQAEQGIRVIIIIDEAQNLPLETIETLRLLSNLETDREKLLQIFLVGQRELEEKIDDPSLRQLNQRITIRYRLTPFNLQETTTYINHRLRLALPSNPAVFPPAIIDLIYRFSGGTPRLINIICERILMAAYINGATTIGKKHYEDAVKSIRLAPDLQGESRPQKREESPSFTWPALLIALLLLILAALVYLLSHSGTFADFINLLR